MGEILARSPAHLLEAMFFESLEEAAVTAARGPNRARYRPGDDEGQPAPTRNGFLEFAGNGSRPGCSTAAPTLPWSSYFTFYGAMKPVSRALPDIGGFYVPSL